MSVVAAIDWNAWRANYDRMSFADHQAFNAEVARLHPDQRCFNADAVREFLRKRPLLRQWVLELGGWDGALAAQMLDEFPTIWVWRNMDITDVPQVCDHKSYHRWLLRDWPWNRSETGWLLIASHVFEHMRMAEIEKLVTAWEPRSIYIDCPIGPGPSSWHNYEGSHILEVGSTELLWRLEQLGYKATHVEADGGLIAYLDRVTA